MRKTRLLSRWTRLAAIAAIMITAGGWFQATPSSSELPVPTIRVSTHLGLDFLVDAHTLSTEDVSGGNKKFNVVLYAASFAPDGKMLGNQSIKVDQAFDAGTYQQILLKGMLLHMDLQPPAGASQLRMAVEDNRTGHNGSLTAPL